MLMTQKHAYTTTMAEGKYRSTDVNYHALGLETMQKLPNAIADPLMVIKSHNYDGRITVITELTDSEGHGIIVPVIMNGKGVWQEARVDANIVATVFGHKKFASVAKNAFLNGEVLYADKKRSDNIARVLGVQFPDKTSNDRSSADIIADLTRAVKGENAENHAENESDEVLYVDKKRSDLLAQSPKVQYDDALNEDRSSEDIIADFVRAVNSEKMQKNHAEYAQDTANGNKTQAETLEHAINHEYGERWLSLRKIAKQI